MFWTLPIRVRILFALAALAASAALCAGPDPLEAAQRDYRAAQSNHLASVHNTAAAWKFARACFDVADFATNDTQRAAFASEGIRIAQAASALDPTDPAPQFYLALNLGQLARTKLWTALGLIKDMEKAFLTSIKLGERFNRGAAHRSLGMLYQQAPGWPASIGSRAKARKHLEKAVELFPGYPDNQLTMLEAYAEWGDLEPLRRGLEAYRKLLPQARETYSGPEWVQPWIDWGARLDAVEKRAAKD